MKSNILKVMAIITIIIIIILIILIYMLNKSNLSSNNTQNQNGILGETIVNSSSIEVEPLKNRNIYFTVVNCVNQYLTYIVNGESESIYTVLESKYIKRNGITKENVLQYVDKIHIKTYFTATDILEEVVDDTNANYYVSRIYSRLFK